MPEPPATLGPTGTTGDAGDGASPAPRRTTNAGEGRVPQLLDADRGRWQVATEASIYILDLDERWFLRAPGAGPCADGQAVAVNTLPHDHEPLPLLHLVRCEIGQRMWLIGDPHPDGSLGRRASTTVLDIRPAGDATPATGHRRTSGDPGGFG